MQKSGLWVVLLLITITLTAAPELGAKEYTIPDIRIEVAITEDGTVNITEHRTYVFDGSFSWANYRLPLKGFSRISDIRVSEGNKAYINENSEFPGSFSVAKSSDAIEVRWYYRASDETRTFTISYELEGALVVGPQWSEFFWNYAAAGREKATDSMAITIALPGSAAPQNMHAWTRGGGDPEERSISRQDGIYSIETGYLARGDHMKLRTVFPSSVLAEEVGITDPDFSLELAREQEKAYWQQELDERELETITYELSRAATILIVALSLWCFYHYYRKYGSRYKARGVSTRETIVMPGQEKPAAVSWLLNNQTATGYALIATFLDLARRGYFKIQEEEGEEGWFSSGKPTFTVQRTEQTAGSELLHWEEEVLDMAQERILQGEDRMSKLFDGNDAAVARWFRKWKQALKDYCMDKGWIDEKSITGLKWNAGLQVILGVTGIAAAWLGGPIAIPAIITAFILAVASLAIIRRTEEGERVYAQWKAYREGLRNIETHSSNEDMLDRHFIYGTALRMSSGQLENIFSSSGRYPSHGMPWIVLLPGSRHSPADMASAITAMAATGTTASAGTSAGGGASAGSAGGGASGGAG